MGGVGRLALRSLVMCLLSRLCIFPQRSLRVEFLLKTDFFTLGLYIYFFYFVFTLPSVLFFSHQVRAFSFPIKVLFVQPGCGEVQLKA